VTLCDNKLYETEREAIGAQAQWVRTHLLPLDDPEVQNESPLPATARPDAPSRCEELFTAWQEAKKARRSIVKTGRRGGAETTAARDRAQWRPWWSPAIGARLPQTLKTEDFTDVIAAMEDAGRKPNTLRTHWVMITAFVN
jgi:hypothetical protein